MSKTMTSRMEKSPGVDHPNFQRLVVWDENHQRNSQRYPDATLEVDITYHREAGWLQVYADEYTKDKRGRVSRRGVWFTLDKEHADKLRKILNHEEVTQ